MPPQPNQRTIFYTPVFQANKAAYDSGKYRFICNEGGSRSSKSYSLAQLMCVIAMTEKVEISVTSPSLPHLKRGAMKDVLDVLKSWEIYSEADHNKTDNIYRFPATGSYIEFFGIEDVGKLRGPGRDILWMNEMNLQPKAAYTQLALRTRRTIFGDLNPSDEYCYVYQMADDPKNKKIHSTFENNRDFLTKEQIEEIESLQDADDNLWKVFGLGLRGTSTETIYTHWKTCEAFPVCDMVWYGLDFGFNHPNVLVKVGTLDDRVYVDEQIYETKLTTDDLAYLIKTLGIDGEQEIFCDSARPDTIEELNRAGLWALPSDKSVWDGIQFVKSKQLFITARSINLIKELRSYKWQVDKNGTVTENPVKFKDDACFIGSTIITTDCGLIPIKDVRPGMRALTTEGYKKVINKFNNGCKEILEYRIQLSTFEVIVQCTPDHLIKADNKWIPISQLRPGQRVNLHKSSITKGLLSTRVKVIIQTALSFFTGIYGSISKEKYQRASISTTSMKTKTTIIFQTWKLKKAVNILAITLKKGLKIIRNGLQGFSLRGLNRLKIGIVLQRGLSGISNTQRISSLGHLIYPKKSANVVVLNLNQRQKVLNFAPITANLSGAENQVSIISKKVVNFVEISSPQISMTKENIAQHHVVSNILGKSAGMQQVYDLEVEEAHEYFANGILVHNCDAMRYAIYTKLSKPLITYAGATY